MTASETETTLTRADRHRILLPAVTDLDRVSATCAVALRTIDQTTWAMHSRSQDTTAMDAAEVKVKQAKRLIDEANEMVKRLATS
jgi:hypothetical protein